MQLIRRLTAAAGLILASGPMLADTALGPDPYAAGYGFDHPDEAEWGGWAIGAAGSLRAEWDSVKDASLGAADDRTAAPDLYSFGTTTAVLSWNAGTFATGSGNLYNFAGPEIYQVKLAGTVAAESTRVALQVEVLGDGFEDSGVRLNGLAPSQSSKTFQKNDYPSSFGPIALQHWLFLWDLPAAAQDYRFDFSAKVHTSLTQVAVDVGTPSSTGTPPVTTTPQDGKVVLALGPEPQDAAEVGALHALRKLAFPASFKSGNLVYKRKTTGKGKSVKTQVSLGVGTGVRSLYFDPETFGEEANRLVAEIFRPGAEGDTKIAECSLDPTKIKLVKVKYRGETRRVGTALYKLKLTKVEYPSRPAKNTFRNAFGECDLNPVADGVQGGIPEIREGDFAQLKRVTGESDE
jgi:hypothetical protein